MSETEGNIAIKAVNLTKKFNGFTAIDGVNLEIKKGEIFAFLGPNGAGKTTTIRMLTTLLLPTGGTIRVNGYNPLTEQDKVRKSFGIVFQDTCLDEELSAYENMEFHGILYGVPKAVRQKRILELLDIVELENRANSYVKTFSSGMKRRLEIARGLLHHPHILFLDEPTAGLDPQTRNQMWNYVLDLNQKENITVFFTTQYIEEAEKVARRIAIIDRGKIIAEGSAQELMLKTNTESLEEAFLTLTGRIIRPEEATEIDQMRLTRKLMKQ